MRRFKVYRPSPPEGYLESGTANPPEEVQFEGVVFSDGTCCVRWLTAWRSHSVWDSWESLKNVHGHPEYGTRVEWLDEREEYSYPKFPVSDIRLEDVIHGYCDKPECKWCNPPKVTFSRYTTGDD